MPESYHVMPCDVERHKGRLTTEQHMLALAASHLYTRIATFMIVLYV